MTTELKPCPFCGADPGVSKYDVDEETSKWAAGCNGDGAPESWAYVEHYISVHASTKAEAIAAWNRRASAPSVGDVREKVALPKRRPIMTGGGRLLKAPTLRYIDDLEKALALLSQPGEGES